MCIRDRGKVFSFQTSTVKADGQKGFADVFYRGHFIWEYKGPHADLGKAYSQLQLYREALDNPPLLIASDIRTIRIHSNFTNRPTVVGSIFCVASFSTLNPFSRMKPARKSQRRRLKHS